MLKAYSYLAVQINMVFRMIPNSITVKKKIENIGIFCSLICVMRNAANVVNTIMLIATAMIVNGNLFFLSNHKIKYLLCDFFFRLKWQATIIITF